MRYELKFGTVGGRAVISDGFTFSNVKRAVQAACDVVRKVSKSRLILIGYDRRFFSPQFAETAARVAVANGFKVEMTNQPISSPTLSFQVRDKKAGMGFMITASHNPYYFNGFKLKGAHGGSVDESITKQVEDRVDAGDIQWGDDAGKKTDFVPSYLASLKKLVKWPNLSALKGPVIFDALYGPGGALFEKLAHGDKRVVFVRSNVDPLFGGVNPEPIETNLESLKEAVLKQKAAVGIAVDGDADRIGIIDDKGRYLPPHTVMPLLLLHLIENRKLKGKVVQTVSMGYLPGRIARKFNLPFEEVSVGFKYIAQRMAKEKVLIGGEESGGYGIGLWSPERDGLLCALLCLELLAKTKKPLSALVDSLYERFGASHFVRVDFPLSADFDRTAWTAHVTTLISPTIGGAPVKSVNTADGIKVITEDDSWFLMRPSGTEPLLRTYAEASSETLLKALIVEAGRLANTKPPNPKKAAEDAKKLKKAKALQKAKKLKK
jgi:phosphomannomutase